MSDKPDLFNRDFQKEQSEKYRFKHIHTGEYCTFEAYVAEFLVLRRADKLNLGKPAYKFWTKGDPNHWIWMKQMNAARALAKKYSEEAVLSLIKSDDFKNLLVLGIQNGKGRGWKVNPSVEPLVEKHHKLFLQKQEKESAAAIIQVIENPEIRKVRKPGKQSVLDKLRGKNGKEGNSDSN